MYLTASETTRLTLGIKIGGVRVNIQLDESAICNGITILYTDGYPSALRKNRRGTSIEKESLKARYRTRKCIIKGRTPYLSKEAEKE
jgi:hypothetical protein